jgi:DNA processing protein
VTEDFKYLLCLAQIPNIGPINAKKLIKIFGSAKATLEAKKKHLLEIEGFGEFRANALLHHKNYDIAEQEIAFAEKNDIDIISIQDKRYPQKLAEAVDAPLVLFYRGNADLNNQKVLSIIGRRQASAYGEKIVQQLMQDLKGQNILILSGLAHGIDSHAHKYAVENELPTIGVLAHGLDRIYPSQNRNLAKRMLDNGGLLTEFFSGTNPDKENFPVRNRIVAGMADATIVVETDITGGSMITANLANGYNREVLAFPGDIYTKNSAGCNFLIKSLKASLITSAADILEILGWEKSTAKKPRQSALFIELEPNERAIYDYLQNKDEAADVDELLLKLSISPSQIAAGTLGLEIKGLLKSLPGKSYCLMN